MKGKLSTTVLVAAIAACLASPAPAFAASADPKPPKSGTGIPKDDDQSRRGDMLRAAKKKAEERFSGADTDKDGFLGKAEVSAAGLDFVNENFAEYDSNSDGKISREEFLSFKRKSK